MQVSLGMCWGDKQRGNVEAGFCFLALALALAVSFKEFSSVEVDLGSEEATTLQPRRK